MERKLLHGSFCAGKCARKNANCLFVAEKIIIGYLWSAVVSNERDY